MDIEDQFNKNFIDASIKKCPYVKFGKITTLTYKNGKKARKCDYETKSFFYLECIPNPKHRCIGRKMIYEYLYKKK